MGDAPVEEACASPPAQVASENAPRKTGYLRKKDDGGSFILRSVRGYWVVLWNDRLDYFKGESDAHPVASIALDSARFVRSSSGFTLFSVQSSRKLVSFQLKDDAQELSSWCDEIESAIRAAMVLSGGPGSPQSPVDDTGEGSVEDLSSDISGFMLVAGLGSRDSERLWLELHGKNLTIFEDRGDETPRTKLILDQYLLLSSTSLRANGQRLASIGISSRSSKTPLYFSEAPGDKVIGRADLSLWWAKFQARMQTVSGREVAERLGKGRKKADKGDAKRSDPKRRKKVKRIKVTGNENLLDIMHQEDGSVGAIGLRFLDSPGDSSVGPDSPSTQEGGVSDQDDAEDSERDGEAEEGRDDRDDRDDAHVQVEKREGERTDEEGDPLVDSENSTEEDEDEPAARLLYHAPLAGAAMGPSLISTPGEGAAGDAPAPSASDQLPPLFLDDDDGASSSKKERKRRAKEQERKKEKELSKAKGKEKGQGRKKEKERRKGKAKDASGGTEGQESDRDGAAAPRTEEGGKASDASDVVVGDAVVERPQSTSEGSVRDEDEEDEFRCRAVFDFEPEKVEQLELVAGDVVTVTERDANGWWFGRRVEDGVEGWFPSTFVRAVVVAEEPLEHQRVEDGEPKRVEEGNEGDVAHLEAAAASDSDKDSREDDGAGQEPSWLEAQDDEEAQLVKSAIDALEEREEEVQGSGVLCLSDPGDVIVKPPVEGVVVCVSNPAESLELTDGMSSGVASPSSVTVAASAGVGRRVEGRVTFDSWTDDALVGTGCSAASSAALSQPATDPFASVGSSEGGGVGRDTKKDLPSSESFATLEADIVALVEASRSQLEAPKRKLQAMLRTDGFLLAHPDKQGYLRMQRSGIRGFNKPRQRWCVLKETALYYFESAGDIQQEGCIDLNKLELQRVPPRKNKFSFLLAELQRKAKDEEQNPFVAPAVEGVRTRMRRAATVAQIAPQSGQKQTSAPSGRRARSGSFQNLNARPASPLGLSDSAGGSVAAMQHFPNDPGPRPGSKAEKLLLGDAAPPGLGHSRSGSELASAGLELGGELSSATAASGVDRKRSRRATIAFRDDRKREKSDGRDRERDAHAWVFFATDELDCKEWLDVLDRAMGGGDSLLPDWDNWQETRGGFVDAGVQTTRYQDEGYEQRIDILVAENRELTQDLCLLRENCAAESAKHFAAAMQAKEQLQEQLKEISRLKTIQESFTVVAAPAVVASQSDVPQLPLAVVRYDWEAKEPTQLSLHEDTELRITKQLQSGWWQGYVDGEDAETARWFPSSYVSLVQRFVDVAVQTSAGSIEVEGVWRERAIAAEKELEIERGHQVEVARRVLRQIQPEVERLQGELDIAHAVRAETEEMLEGVKLIVDEQEKENRKLRRLVEELQEDRTTAENTAASLRVQGAAFEKQAREEEQEKTALMERVRILESSVLEFAAAKKDFVTSEADDRGSELDQQIIDAVSRAAQEAGMIGLPEQPTGLRDEERAQLLAQTEELDDDIRAMEAEEELAGTPDGTDAACAAGAATGTESAVAAAVGRLKESQEVEEALKLVEYFEKEWPAGGKNGRCEGSVDAAGLEQSAAAVRAESGAPEDVSETGAAVPTIQVDEHEPKEMQIADRGGSEEPKSAEDTPMAPENALELKADVSAKESVVIPPVVGEPLMLLQESSHSELGAADEESSVTGGSNSVPSCVAATEGVHAKADDEAAVDELAANAKEPAESSMRAVDDSTVRAADDSTVRAVDDSTVRAADDSTAKAADLLAAVPAESGVERRASGGIEVEDHVKPARGFADVLSREEQRLEKYLSRGGTKRTGSSSNLREAEPARRMLLCRTQYSWTGKAGQLTLGVGDLVVSVVQDKSGWWKGSSADGTYGWFPAKYVRVVREARESDGGYAVALRHFKPRSSPQRSVSPGPVQRDTDTAVRARANTGSASGRGVARGSPAATKRAVERDRVREVARPARRDQEVRAKQREREAMAWKMATARVEASARRAEARLNDSPSTAGGSVGTDRRRSHPGRLDARDPSLWSLSDRRRVFERS